MVSTKEIQICILAPAAMPESPLGLRGGGLPERIIPPKKAKTATMPVAWQRKYFKPGAPGLHNCTICDSKGHSDRNVTRWKGAFVESASERARKPTTAECLRLSRHWHSDLVLPVVRQLYSHCSSRLLLWRVALLVYVYFNSRVLTRPVAASAP